MQRTTMSASTSLPSCSSRHVFSARPARRGAVMVRAVAQTPADLDKPAWTGDSILSRVVNWAIETPALYNVMKVFAKKAMKNSAESRGVRWDSHVQELEATPELLKIQAALENPSVKYPDYYLKPFHAYTTGNLEWLAAYEVEPATYAMGIRTFKAHPDWSAEKCFVVMRESITDAMKAYMKQHNLAEPKTLVDMGCSVGMSTQWMAQAWPSAAAVTGLDLSTYMLAVAEWNRRQLSKPNRQGIQARIFPDGSRLAPITYVHGVAENSPFADASVDLCAFNFVTHECPQHAMEDFCREAARIVKPGGLLTFVDNNPKSKTIQNLPPAIFTLMKSTEPWSDEYYAFDLEAAMRKEGFQEVVTVEADHRHRVVMGYKPAAN